MNIRRKPHERLHLKPGEEEKKREKEKREKEEKYLATKHGGEKRVCVLRFFKVFKYVSLRYFSERYSLILDRQKTNT